MKAESVDQGHSSLVSKTTVVVWCLVNSSMSYGENRKDMIRTHLAGLSLWILKKHNILRKFRVLPRINFCYCKTHLVERTGPRGAVLPPTPSQPTEY